MDRSTESAYMKSSKKLLGQIISKPFATVVVTLVGLFSGLLLSFFIYLQIKSIETLKLSRLGSLLINSLSPRMNLFGFSTILFLGLISTLMFAVTYNKNIPNFKLLNMLGWHWRKINIGIIIDYMAFYALGYGIALLIVITIVKLKNLISESFFSFIRPFITGALLLFITVLLVALISMPVMLIRTKTLARKTISFGARNAILITTLFLIFGVAIWQIRLYINQSNVVASSMSVTTQTIVSQNEPNIYRPNISEYALKLVFDPIKNTIIGSEKIVFVNRFEEPINQIVFNLYPNSKPALSTNEIKIPMEVLSAKVGSETVKAETNPSKSVLTLPLMKNLDRGAKLDIEIEYCLTMDKQDLEKGVVWYSKAFYPILAIYDSKGWRKDTCLFCDDPVLSDQGTYTMSLVHPANIGVFTNATLRTSEKLGVDKVTDIYESQPLRELFISFSDNFIFETKQSNSVPITVASIGDKHLAGELLSKSIPILNWYSETFAEPPFEKFSLLALESTASGGNSFDGGARFFYRKDMRGVEEGLSEMFAAQYFSERISVDIYRGPWVASAPNIYLSWLYLRSLPTRTLYEDSINKAEDKKKDIHLGCSLMDQQEGIACYYEVARNNAPLALLKIENILGSEQMLNSLKAYYFNCKNLVCDKDNIIKALENEGKYDLAPILQ